MATRRAAPCPPEARGSPLRPPPTRLLPQWAYCPNDGQELEAVGRCRDGVWVETKPDWALTAYYDAFGPLAHVVLEDSWVLAIWPSDDMLTFDIEVALANTHPDYAGPAPGEQHDYRRARLVLQGAMSCTLSGASPASGATGSSDLGHIDSWAVDETGLSRLDGDWGVAEGRPRAVALNFA